jgi:DNA-binding MarR family transcriptional regulator
LSRIWRPIPLHHLVIETLNSLGSCDDTELLRSLRKEVEITPDTLNKILLQLEIRGLIRVSNTTRGRKKIELVKR